MDLDVSGLVCPQPVQVVRRCLAEMDPGQELVVTGDYPPAQRSISRTCYKHGFAVETTDLPNDDGEFTVRIRVTESSSLSERVADEKRESDAGVDADA